MKIVFLISTLTGSHIGKFSHGRVPSRPEIRVTFERLGRESEFDIDPAQS